MTQECISWRCIPTGVLLLIAFSPFLQAADEINRIGSPLHFRLPSIEGELVQLFDSVQTEFAVVCFLGTECPLAKLYGPRLQTLADEFADQHVQFVGVNSNVQDSIEEIRQYAQLHQIRFPMLSDKGNKVADAYGASRTTEVFLIDSRFEIRYRGRIDDQYQPGRSRSEPTRFELRDAIRAVLSGNPVLIQETEPVGCILGRVPSRHVTTQYTFANEISRILQKHCVECHREGEIGPFSLTNFDEVVGWGEMLVEVIDQKRMPPWHANPEFGHFSNARDMPETDKEILRNWVAGGMPFGDETMLPPPLPETTEWDLTKDPELIVEMSTRPFSVPAEGVVEYQYFVVDPHFEDDKWIREVQVVPGNRAVVHHCIVFIRPPDGSNYEGVGWLGGYVPGQKPLRFKPGYAKKVPAGSKLVFQMHYTPTGTPQVDITRIGMIFGRDEEITNEVFTVIGINPDFEIPPQAADFPVTANVNNFPRHGELLGMTPHMHLRGKSFRVTATKQGTESILLDVPHYDFNWQHFYVFQQPLPLNDVEKLDFTATFDNSAKNPVNPDPLEHVTWGDQTWQEMAIAFFAVAQPRESRETNESDLLASRQGSSEVQALEQQRIEKFVEQFFGKFDRDRDGMIMRDELPLSLETFGFRQLNKNMDDHLSREEIRKLAEKSLKNR